MYATSFPGAIFEQIQTVPPKCLQGASVTADVFAGNPYGVFAVAWQFSGSACNADCSVLGVPTQVGSDPRSTLMFGGLAIRVGNTLVEIFDPSIHGYHNENARLERGIVKARKPEQYSNRKEFICLNCGSSSFFLTGVFYYQQGAIDVFRLEPDLPLSDMFTSFNLLGECAACRTRWTIAEFDGL